MAQSKFVRGSQVRLINGTEKAVAVTFGMKSMIVHEKALATYKREKAN